MVKAVPEDRSSQSAPSQVTWVVFRGLGREAGHWADVPQKLAMAIPGAHVVCADLPGAGVLHKQTSPLSVPAIARAVRETVLKESNLGALRLVGLSLGGMVALSWAEQWPSEIGGLALVSASVGGVCPPWWRCTPSAFSAFLGIALSRNGSAREAKILALTSSNAETQMRALDSWTSIANKQPVSRANLARQLLAATFFRPHLSPLPIPTLVIAGQLDRIVNIRCATRLGEALAAPVLIHPTAGHDVPLDEPDWLVQQLAALS